MPSMEMLLTWVVRVDAVFLGAHLEAYIKLLPITQTLRLCHRFGIGENVHIHRLPTELVAHIEGYLMKEEARPTEAEWFLSNYCFTGECDPVHHHSKEQLLRLRSHYLPGREDSTSEQPRDTAIPLTPDDRHTLNEYMADDYPENDEILPGLDEWRMQHDYMCSLWVDFAGEPGKSGRGFFTKHKELLRKHFGLDAWISHAVSDPGKLGWHDEESMTTLAYLTLPTTSAATEKWSQRVAGVVDTLMLPSENTSEHCISPPPQPTERSMARFARALRILNLKSYPLSWNQDLVAGSVPRDKSGGESGDDGREGFSEEYPPQGWRELRGPALRLLVANKDLSAPDEI